MDNSDGKSPSHLETWLNEIATYTSSDECVMLLVGNKAREWFASRTKPSALTRVVQVDLEARAVSREEGQQFARDHAMVFIETSAKTREGIKHTFEELVQKVLDNPRLEAETRPKDKSNIVKQVAQPQGAEGDESQGCGSC